MRLVYGPGFKGLDARIEAAAMDRATTDDMCGVYTNRGGIIRAPGLVRVEDFGLGDSKAATCAGTEWIQVANGTDTFHLLGVRWTVIMAFKPTNISGGDQYLMNIRRTISGGDYYAPAIIVESDGTITLKWTQQDGTDKSVTSTLTVSDDNTYYLLAYRLDDDMYLYIGSATSAMTLYCSKSGLGVDDYPGDTGTHHLIWGADGSQANGFIGTIDNLTLLDTAVEGTTVAGFEFPMPRLRSCLSHLPLNAAAGSEFEDWGYYSADHVVTHAAGVTHEATGLVLAPGTFQLLGETVVPDGKRYANTIYRGQLYASRLNA